ncbi:hypothetical protein BOSE62_110099 [Bosea sp. 62]|nr:hypothetical protein BOSE21B_50507 [Bosea sp. 21B]CAD5290328.1 hypothetical protein BOSE46_70481 [Bosea sp. 46]CAD5300930.1 hypothetical protein BOSE7B_90186 [Bosea sp. 7B]VVT60394.1 hypothetical protein BOS5A_211185 [Bosea sp. EC-HK365B]VXA98582.1 hypothetical protein BOSE62_110099 [Bosea sp. 62]VXB59713.1 hypothetical protein BOSE127_140129 [Bosea sp. 127]
MRNPVKRHARLTDTALAVELYRLHPDSKAHLCRHSSTRMLVSCAPCWRRRTTASR